jgi:hypothetical protein
MHNDMTFAAAQADMRSAYAGGVIGIMVSGTVWLVAGAVAWFHTPHTAIIALLVGGALIHPIGVLLAKLCKRSGAHVKGNPLGQLAGEATGWMLLGIALAYGLSLWRTDLFFPAMLLAIGGRYLTFATVYGMRVYWAFGATLAASGLILPTFATRFAAGAFAGGIIEMIFAAVVYMQLRSREESVPVTG